MKTVFKEKKVNAEKFIESRIENYWNKRSKEFSQVRKTELNGINGKAWLDLIQKNIPQSKILKILDVGTGAGFFSILLAKCGHDVTGIDMSPKMILEAKKNMLEFGCRVNFKQMNAQNLNFENEIFDVVISRNLTWTLPDAMQAYREWHRVLKFGGILMNFDSDYGDKNFLNGKTCAKAEVNDEMLAECNSIKNNLRISTHTRPQWDINFLFSLGFKINFDDDISQLVQKDKNIEYDSVPLFAIYATKNFKTVRPC